jgi:dTDP-4-dehydrorhamnose 3,5-epimerase
VVKTTTLPGILTIEPEVFIDERGSFTETYHLSRFNEAGVVCSFVQDNHSRSKKGTLRGLHYQLPRPQAKLCQVLRGSVLDIAVDVRWGSPYFGNWVAIELSDQTHRSIFIPAGFAHGFLVLSETADFLYKCSTYYEPEGQKGIAWNDPDLKLPWGTEMPLLSEKDGAFPRLADVPISELPGF